MRNGVGPARLLDMIPGRSKAVFKQWLVARPRACSDAIEAVAMDGFAGFKTATTEELPQATAVMDPFHVVRLAADLAKAVLDDDALLASLGGRRHADSQHIEAMVEPILKRRNPWEAKDG